MNRKEVLIDEFLSWPGVTQKPHRFGGIEFLFEGKEIGHIHGNHLVDLLLPKSKRDEAVADGSAQPHHMYPDSGWVSVYLKSDTDMVNAIKLMRFKYEYLI
ncbi:luciferase family protein [Bacillus sp. 03113]|uniref:luciferase domain-containing protein n=1 Tax=Bacillus sp. 03113 TaxID=2578211 RepID=UPI001143BE74|nr:luciferase family protein [Bacillus sp. 03113]